MAVNTLLSTFNALLYTFRGTQIGLSEITLILLFLFIVFLVIRNFALPVRD